MLKIFSILNKGGQATLFNFLKNKYPDISIKGSFLTSLFQAGTILVLSIFTVFSEEKLNVDYTAKTLSKG